MFVLLTKTFAYGNDPTEGMALDGTTIRWYNSDVSCFNQIVKINTGESAGYRFEDDNFGSYAILKSNEDGSFEVLMEVFTREEFDEYLDDRNIHVKW